MSTTPFDIAGLMQSLVVPMIFLVIVIVIMSVIMGAMTKVTV
ncbi:MAG: hypothetical protein QW599_05500 [Nitrososphaerota archaeon]